MVLALLMLVGVVAVQAPRTAWASDSLQMGTQISGLDQHSYENDTIVVRNVTSGLVHYNKLTKTLTLTDATFYGIYLYDGCPDFKIKLIGKNKLGEDEYGNMGKYCIYDDSSSSSRKCNISIVGIGSITGGIDCRGNLSTGLVTSDLVEINATSIECGGNMSLHGGAITASEVTCDGNLSALDCNLTSSGKVSCKGNVTLTNGNLVVQSTDKYSALKCADLSITNSTFTCGGTVSCGMFTMKSGSVHAGINCTGFNMQGGVLSKKGGDFAVSCDGNFTLSGGNIVAENNASGILVGVWNTYTNLAVNISGGSIKCISPSDYGVSFNSSNLNMSGGSIEVVNSSGVGVSVSSTTHWGTTYGGNATLSGGSISANDFTCDGDLVVSGGQVTASKVLCHGNFTMSDGSLSSTNGKNGLSSDGNIMVSGGKIDIVNPSSNGIYASAGDITITGGTVSVTNAYGSGIRASSSTVRGTTVGGRVFITGGSVTATVNKPSLHSAISADEMTNEVGCLKTILGSLPRGASFKVKGNVYMVGTKWGTSSVILAKYGASSKKPSFKNVKFGGYRYSINGVGPKAFNTRTGKKVQRIIFKNTLSTVGANAFFGTKSLKDLRIMHLPWQENYKKGKLKSVKWQKGYSIDKKAFRKCGKKNGKSLTVKIGRLGVYEGYAGKYKKALTSKGLPKGAKLYTYD